jgi:hypothetical protein
MFYPEPSSQIATILASNLRTVFPELCVQRYGIPLPFECVPASDGSSWTVQVQIGSPEAPHLTGQFSIRHVGGNMYDVQLAVAEGPTTSFCYCMSEEGPSLVPKTPHLAWEGAAFLLDALERRVGRLVLSHPGPGQRSSFLNPSLPSAARPVRSNP